MDGMFKINKVIKGESDSVFTLFQYKKNEEVRWRHSFYVESQELNMIILHGHFCFDSPFTKAITFTHEEEKKLKKQIIEQPKHRLRNIVKPYHWDCLYLNLPVGEERRYK